MDSVIDTVVGRLWTSDGLGRHFHALCDLGGRLAGTESHARAQEYVSEQLDSIAGTRHDDVLSFTGRIPGQARIALHNTTTLLDAVTLPGSPAGTGEALTVVDLGAGTERDFAAAGDTLAGCVALVNHEYPFTTGHTHRRLKYRWAVEAGARAFLLVNNNPGCGPVTGGCGTGSARDIPGVGISYEGGERLRQIAATGKCRIDLAVDAGERTWDARNLIVDVPGRSRDYVVLCAHLDGHDLAESAMDNATGVATVLEIGRLLAPFVESFNVGLRLALFTVEEWGLAGSRHYVEQLPDDERNAIKVAIALDSITGHARLAALTAGGAHAEGLLRQYAAMTGIVVDAVRPLLSNSDHANFQKAGIPAMRLIAGYGREDSLTRYLLTRRDTRAIVDAGQLKAAATTAALLTYLACAGPTGG